MASRSFREELTDHILNNLPRGYAIYDACGQSLFPIRSPSGSVISTIIAYIIREVKNKKVYVIPLEFTMEYTRDAKNIEEAVRTVINKQYKNREKYLRDVSIFAGGDFGRA